MSLSKIYKGGDISCLQALSFADFGDDGGLSGGGMTPGAAEFHEAPVAQQATPSAQDQAQAPCEPSGPDLDHLLEEAHAKGRREGIQEMEGRFGTAALSFSAAVEEIGRLRETILKNSTDDMLRLVMAIVEQVIPCEVAANPDIIHHTIVKALQAAVRSDQYHIKVNPDDMNAVMEKKPLLLASISGLKNITLEAEPSIAQGGCLVESELGEVDATVEGQLEEIRQKILHAAALD